jgi:hypothetical protein
VRRGGSCQATVGTPSGPTVTKASPGVPPASVPELGSTAELKLACAIWPGRDQVRPPSTERAAITSSVLDASSSTVMR